MFGRDRQSDTAEAAQTLLGHAGDVAADTSLPDWIRTAAVAVGEQALHELREHTR